MSIDSTVLIVGGAGNVGRRMAETLRVLYPDLPLVIGGRDLGRSQAVAAALKNSEARSVDLRRGDLGLGAEAFGAVVMFVKDPTMNALRFAQDRGAAYVDISTAAFEIAPEVALFARKPAAAPVLLSSHWLAGASTFTALHYAARDFRNVRSIAISAVLDEHDLGGPAAFADYERQVGASPSALVLDDGRWRWIESATNKRRFVDGAGFEHQGAPYTLMDNLTLAAATSARSVRFDLAVGTSSGRRRGEPFSTEFAVEIEGDRKDGTAGSARYDFVHPEGQAKVTAAGVAAVTERLLGLHGGPPVAPGLYTPEVLVDPAHAMSRFMQFGARIQPAEGARR